MTFSSDTSCPNPETGWRLRRPGSLVLAAFIVSGVLALPVAAQAQPASGTVAAKLDRELERRADLGTGFSRVIVRLKSGASLGSDVESFNGRRGRRLFSIDGEVVEVPNAALRALADHPAVASLHFDRPIGRLLNHTSITTGATLARQEFGLTGAGIGVAVIDSGVTPWHDDLTGGAVGNQRVSHFADFVNGHTTPYDDNGHGTHVAGTIAGNGYDSAGWRTGIAPEADIVALKVLDETGAGTISNVIAAFDYALAARDAFNIRVINISIGAGISESYWTDPLTLAAKRAVDAGIVVVAAAGNLGRGSEGQTLYGSVTAPANAPWVLAVGASSHQGTVNRGDDTVASFSSRGPTYIDWLAKPDLVAPGYGTVSLSDPASRFYEIKSSVLLDGRVSTSYQPYLSLSGTSMASPVVAGTVALMLEANPDLTPNLVKGILQYTAESRPGFDLLSQGAGFLNTLGAVRLARFFRDAQPGDHYPIDPTWSRHVLWGNYRVAGGVLVPTASAWHDNIVWGSDWGNIVWGTACGDFGCDNIVWGSDWGGFDNVVWGSDFDNIVWGFDFDNIVWGSDFDNIVWGSSFDNIVWGSSFDNIVWGSDCGGANCGNIVWGSSQLENIVWGSGFDNIVWGSGWDNIVWGSGFDNIVWGSDFDNIVWGFSGGVIGMWDPAHEVDPLTVTEAEIFGATPAEASDEALETTDEVVATTEDTVSETLETEVATTEEAVSETLETEVATTEEVISETLETEVATTEEAVSETLETEVATTEETLLEGGLL